MFCIVQEVFVTTRGQQLLNNYYNKIMSVCVPKIYKPFFSRRC